MIPPELMKQAVDVLGGTATLGRQVTNPDDLASLVHDGIPETALNAFISRMNASNQKDSPLCTADLFERQSTLDTVTPVLTSSAGHALIRIVRLFVLLSDGFDSEGRATRFLMTEHPALNNMLPAIAALTEAGSQAVDEIVARGEHGLPA